MWAIAVDREGAVVAARGISLEVAEHMIKLVVEKAGPPADLGPDQYLVLEGGK